MGGTMTFLKSYYTATVQKSTLSDTVSYSDQNAYDNQRRATRIRLSGG